MIGRFQFGQNFIFLKMIKRFFSFLVEIALSVLLIPVLLMWQKHERDRLDRLFMVRCDDPEGRKR